MKILFAILPILLIISCKKQNTADSKKPLEVTAHSEPEREYISSQKTYSLNGIKATLLQTQSDGMDFYCKSKLLISKGNKTIDSLTFTPEPVGGYFGISIPQTIENHLIFTKHGDYDGRTIIINSQGQIFNIIGGENYYDSETKRLFAIYESDIRGFAVFDLKIDSMVFETQEIQESPISFHKASEGRYFLNSLNEELENVVMEIEFSPERIVKTELTADDIDEDNILQNWPLENVNCKCEK